ncbi:MAG: muramidase [Sphingomonadales bacterium]|nr:muramidase [Sphingomonadales bacterium]
MLQHVATNKADRPPFKLPLVQTVVTALLFIFSWMPAAAQPERFISKYGPLADSLDREYGIPASLILGVSIIESSSGTSRNCRLLHNFFGVKGRNNLLKTKGIRSGYKQYATDTASFVDFCKIVSRKKVYASLKGNTDSKKWVAALSKTGYSEVPATWQSLINNTIRKHELEKRNSK